MVVVSQEAQNLLEGRPDWWEYKLFALLHRDAFSDFERPDLLQPPLRPDVGSTFRIESASDFAATVQSLVDLLARLVESMEGSINISSHDMTRCFGPPGQSGDPQSIQTLIYRLRSHAKDCCERLARVQALKISSSNASVHEAAQFFLRSVVSYANHEFDRNSSVSTVLDGIGNQMLISSRRS